MVILSAIRKDDTQTVATKKIKAVSYYLDYLSTVRILNGKENTYDNIRDLMFDVAKQVRDLNLVDLKQVLESLISQERDQLDAMRSVSYQDAKRQDLLHLLARVATELEDSLELSTKVGFQNYVDRTRDSKTFDIEHLLTSSFADVNADLGKANKSPFASQSTFEKQRDMIGGLILLPRGRNRSMKDMVYSEKLSRYSNENVLAQTLTESFFLNQPNWTKFSAESRISCDPILRVDETALTQRAEFYFLIAKRIWDKEQLKKAFI